MCGQARLSEVFEREEWRQSGVSVVYQYNFGDHHIQFLGKAEPFKAKAMRLERQEVFCFGGEGHPCCEDSGGIMGFEEIKVSRKARPFARNRREESDLLIKGW